MAIYLKRFSTTSEYETYIADSPILPNVSLVTETNEVAYNPYIPIHQFEVWADSECTIRPEVGQSYSSLYVQVNKQVDIIPAGEESPYDFESGSDYTSLTVYPGNENYPGDTSSIYLYIDYMWHGTTPLSPIPIGVYECNANEAAYTVQSPLVVSFGDII